MKRFLTYIFALFVLWGIHSCGKYSFDFQDGFQNGETDPSAIDTNMFVADKSMYHRAKVFPGLIGDKIVRIKDTLIMLDARKSVISNNDYKVSAAPQAIFSLGLYAPAGELIKIVVPAGVYGLRAQVGVHMDDLSGLSDLRRDPRIYTQKELAPGVNYVLNLYGGLIWMRSNVAIANPIELHISGAVRSPDFIHTMTSIQDWKQDVLNTDVPWLELRSERMVMTVPRSSVLQFINQGKFDDLNEVMSEWKLVYEHDYYDWMGLSKDASSAKDRYPEFPERVVLDIQPSVGYAHSGFPWVAQLDLYWLGELTNVDNIRRGISWGAYHEVGHNYQQGTVWSWGDLGETTNNLFIFKGAHRHDNVPFVVNYHKSVKESIPLARAFANDNIDKSFSNLDIPPYNIKESGFAPFFRIIPFLQIFHKTKGINGEQGWEFFNYIYSKSRNNNIQLNSNQAKIDYFYRSLCEFTGKDYYRFLYAYGIPVSLSAKKAMRELYPASYQEIWNFDPSSQTGGDTYADSKIGIPTNRFVITGTPSAGVFTNLIDKNLTTYWTSCTTGDCTNSLSAPVSLIYDMATIRELSGFYYRNQQGGLAYATKVNVYASNDNAKWTLVQEATLASPTETPAERNARRTIFFSNYVEARYLKFEFPANNLAGTKHVSIAELEVFYEKK